MCIRDRASGGVGALVACGVPFTACSPVTEDFGEAFRAGRLARHVSGLPDGTSASVFSAYFRTGGDVSAWAAVRNDALAAVLLAEVAAVGDPR
eukprot:10739162-Alexandrium_andersonii.AAC.1